MTVLYYSYARYSYAVKTNGRMDKHHQSLVQHIISVEPLTLDRGRKESIGMYNSREKMVTRLKKCKRKDEEGNVDLHRTLELHKQLSNANSQGNTMWPATADISMVSSKSVLPADVVRIWISEVILMNSAQIVKSTVKKFFVRTNTAMEGPYPCVRDSWRKCEIESLLTRKNASSLSYSSKKDVAFF